MPRPAPDPEHIARVGELFAENRSLREIAEIMRQPAPEGRGIEISHETVRQWVIKWREAETWLVAKEEADKQAEREVLRSQYVAFLERIIRDGVDRYSPSGGGTYEAVAPIVLRAAMEKMKFLGEYAPTRIDVGSSGLPPAPDSQTVAAIGAAIERAREQATADGRALLSGNEES